MIDSKLLDIKHIFSLLVSKLPLFIILAILLGGVSYAYSEFMITPVYSTTVSIYVNSRIAQEQTTASTSVRVIDISNSERLIPTYIAIISTDSALSKAAEASGLKYSPAQIRGMFTTSTINDTAIFKITVKNAKPGDAQTIANTLAEVATTEISNYIDGTSVKIIDRAKLPSVPSSPNVKKNTTTGAMFGFIIGILLALILDVFDVRIIDEADLERVVSYPCLGSVPSISGNPEDNSSYYFYSSNRKEKK